MDNAPERSSLPREPGPEGPATSAPRLPYLPALDGLRALAVLAVLFYHANLVWLPGGFLGVEMFFVISGYLIASLLLAEWTHRGGIDLKGFWLRRARRLFPALFLLLLLVSTYTLVFLPREAAGLRGDVWSTAAYVNNWYQIFSHKSYFETVGRPSLLRHMWSLAVEEQFYLVWPLVFGGLMGRLGRKRMLWLVLAGGLVSSLWMAALYQPDADPSRCYYGTDTRAAGLLLGIALAFVRPPGATADPSRGAKLEALGLAALGTLLGCFLFLHEYHGFLYRGGFLLTGLATAALIAVAVHPGARLLPRWFSWPALRWVGLRSYGIYLWHFPVLMVTRPQLDVPWDGVMLLGLRVALVMVLAGLSYRFVETPLRQGVLGQAWTMLRQAGGRERVLLHWQWAAACLPVVAAFTTCALLLWTARPSTPPAYLAAKAHGQTTIPPTAATNANRQVPPGGAPVLSASLTATTWVSPPLVPTTFPPEATRLDPREGVTAIGDSVMEGVAEELRQSLGPNLVLEANQGRLPWDTPNLVRRLRAEGKIQPVVILHIGNNGFFSADVLAQIMAELKQARRVVVVNIKAPRRWESLNNRVLADAVRAYPNVVLADWQQASRGRPRLFWTDGIHVRNEGARVYADLIVQALKAPNRS